MNHPLGSDEVDDVKLTQNRKNIADEKTNQGNASLPNMHLRSIKIKIP